jgi:hypothetical protein
MIDRLIIIRRIERPPLCGMCYEDNGEIRVMEPEE